MRLYLSLSFLLLAMSAWGQDASIRLVAPQAALEQLPSFGDAVSALPLESLDAAALVEHAAAGGTLVWLGPPENLPPELWVGSFALSQQAVTLRPEAQCPLPGLESFNGSAVAHSAFIRPPNEFPKHNIDEEIRADFIPILGAYDRFGELIGYPGVLMSHVAPSLVKNRFNGAQCYFFFFDAPQTLAPAQLSALLDPIVRAHRSGLVIERVETNFAAYHPGERVQLRVRIRNPREKSLALEVSFQELHEDGSTREITHVRRVAGGKSATEATADFTAESAPGLHRILVEVRLASPEPEKLALSNPVVPVARRETGMVVLDENWKTPPLMNLEGGNFSFDGQQGFYAGTHYYPSNVWWEWDWRDFRPAQAARDFRGMRKGGNRLVRVWLDPVLDETVLRALDAAIWLAAREGIAIDVCVFNQWVRDLGYETEEGNHVHFEFRHPKDFNLYSFSLRNLDHQRAYLGVLAKRWRNAGNVIYNLANETYVKNPDASQMDPEVQAWEEAALPEGTRRDTLLFRRWGEELTQAVREAGGTQPVFPGYMFSLHDGGDAYLAHANSPLVSWHGYFAPEAVGQTIHYLDPISSGRPLLLEEFGNLGWNGVAHYDAAMHYALAGGAGAAMSYEWGVSWISPESSYVPLPMRDALAEPADPRWFGPIIDYAKQNTSEYGVGIAPWPSGFGYGSIYHGTPFMAEAAQAVWRLASVGARFARAPRDHQVYVVVPEGAPMAIEPSFPLWKSLWLEGITFGVWQEAELETLPQSAATVLLAAPVSPASQELLQRRKLKVYPPQDLSWKEDAALPRVAFSPRGALNLLQRPTLTGTLYALMSDEVSETVELALPGQAVRAQHDRFTLVHATGEGVDFIEGAGEISVEGARLCAVSEGRALLLSEDSSPLDRAARVLVITKQPCTLKFAREIEGVEIMTSGASAGDAISGTALRVDDQMTRYVMRVSF